jgi:hypothetical protein
LCVDSKPCRHKRVGEGLEVEGNRKRERHSKRDVVHHTSEDTWGGPASKAEGALLLRSWQLS